MTAGVVSFWTGPTSLPSRFPQPTEEDRVPYQGRAYEMVHATPLSSEPCNVSVARIYRG